MKRVLLSILIVMLVCQVNAQKISNGRSINAHLFLLSENNENEDSFRRLDLKRRSNNYGNRIPTAKVSNKLETSKRHEEFSKLENKWDNKRKLNGKLLNDKLNSSVGNKKSHPNAAFKTKSVKYSSHLLDSVVASLYPSDSLVGKVLFTYDSKQRLIQEIHSDFEDGEWYMRKKVYTYNDANQLTTFFAYDWNTTLQSWNLYYKANYQYDGNGNTILEEVSRWNESINNWIYDYKTEMQYDSKGNEILSVYSDWSQSGNKWIYSSKYEIQFDSNANMTLKISSNWDVSYSKWIYDRKSEKNYDNSSNLIFEAYYSWSNIRNDWDGMYNKKIYEYDKDGNQLLNSTFSWNSNSNDWEQDFLYAYDSNGNQIISLERTGSTINGISQYSGYKYEDIRNDAGYLTQYIAYDWDNSNHAWLKYRKYEYTRDANNNETFYIRSNWNVVTNNWDLKVKNEYTYDVNNNNTLTINYIWNENLQNWDLYSKDEYSYDSNNLFLQLITHSWSKTLSTWTNHSKYVNSRDNLKNVTLQEVFSWNNIKNSWDLTGKYDLTYGKDFTSDVYSEYDSSTNSWINIEKWEYAYDSNENQTHNAYYKWDKTTNAWVGNGNKYEKAFDNVGRQTLEANYYWSTIYNTWVGSGTKYEKAFDAAGKQILDATYNWSDTSNSWKGYNKEEYMFDNLGRETLSTEYDWDEFTKNWKGLYKSVTTYNNFTVIINWYDERVIDNIVYYRWGTISNDWDKYGTERRYYSEINTSLKNIDQNNVSIYPTVASSYVTVSVNYKLIGSTFSVIDILGHTVLKGVIANETTNWDVSQWSKGIYLLKIGNQNQSTLKIIKK